MKKIILIPIAVITIAASFTACSSQKDPFEGAQTLMMEQIDQLGSVATIDELMAVQVKNGDTIVQLMAQIEPSLTQEQVAQLQKLNQQYNLKLRKVADSLLQNMVVDSITVVEESVVQN